MRPCVCEQKDKCARCRSSSNILVSRCGRGFSLWMFYAKDNGVDKVGLPVACCGLNSQHVHRRLLVTRCASGPSLAYRSRLWMSWVSEWVFSSGNVLNKQVLEAFKQSLLLCSNIMNKQNKQKKQTERHHSKNRIPSLLPPHHEASTRCQHKSCHQIVLFPPLRSSSQMVGIHTAEGYLCMPPLDFALLWAISVFRCHSLKVGEGLAYT